jgi:hypothetical protein
MVRSRRRRFDVAALRFGSIGARLTLDCDIVLKRASDMWPVPEARWQSLQWHWPMPSSCPLIEYVIVRHRQRPTTCTFAISSTPHSLRWLGVGSRTSPGYTPGTWPRDHVKAEPGQNANVLEKVDFLRAPRRLCKLPVAMRRSACGDHESDQ